MSILPPYSNNEIKIAVLIPTYNRIIYLRDCIEKMQYQTHNNIEIIVYDDGSTDNTRGVMKLMIQKDNRIKYYLNYKNQGVAKARNRLLNITKDHNIKIAIWQDSDDFSNIHRIKEQLKAYTMSGNPVIYADWVSNYRLNAVEFSKLWQLKPAPNLVKRASCFPTIMFDVDKAIEFNETKKTGEDTAWKSAMKNKYGHGHKLHKCVYYVRRLEHKKRLGKR